MDEMQAALAILNRGQSLFSEDGSVSVGLHKRELKGLTFHLQMSDRGHGTFIITRPATGLKHGEPVFRAKWTRTGVPKVDVYTRGPWEGDLLALNG